MISDALAIAEPELKLILKVFDELRHSHTRQNDRPSFLLHQVLARVNSSLLLPPGPGNGFETSANRRTRRRSHNVECSH